MDIDCEGWSKILKVFPDMDFSAELEEKPELSSYLRNAINSKALEMQNPEEHKDCPKLDNDFSRHIMLNGLPLCDAAKAQKLVALIIKLFAKRNFTVAEESIEMNFGADGMTTGQCFITLKTDEQAKIAAAFFNGHKLDSKHTFSACTFPDFDKIMAYEDSSA